MSFSDMVENFWVSCVGEFDLGVNSGEDAVEFDSGEGDSEESSKFSVNLLSETM